MEKKNRFVKMNYNRVDAFDGAAFPVPAFESHLESMFYFVSLLPDFLYR